MAVETVLETAAAELASAASLADVLDAACVAADAGEAAATALAHEGVTDGPGYLAVADSFAAVRVGLEKWADVPPTYVAAVVRLQPAEIHRRLADLATALLGRLSELTAPTDDALAVAIADARAAAADACRALSGPVRDDADLR